MRATRLFCSALLLLGAVAAAGAVQDTLRLRDGSAVKGTLRTYGGDSFLFETSGETKTFPRAEVSSVLLGHEEVRTGLPPGISVTGGLTVDRWTAVRRITKFGAGPDHKQMYMAKMDGHGSRILFASIQGVYTVKTDGTGLVRLTKKKTRIVDISVDGGKVAWYVGGEGFFTADSDGSNRRKLPAKSRVWSIAMTASGDRVFALTGPGIVSFASDGSGQKTIVTTEQAAKAGGTKVNRNYWPNDDAVDVSDNGSRIAFKFSQDLFVANGDGSGVRAITSYRKNPKLWSITSPRISGDGTTLAFWHDSSKSMNFYSWEGGHLFQYRDVHHGGGGLELSGDGSVAGLSWGVRFFKRDGSGQYHPVAHGGMSPNPVHRARSVSFTRDMKKACVVTDLASSWNAAPSELSIIEFNPMSLGGVPHIEKVAITPMSLKVDGSDRLAITAEPKAAELRRMGHTSVRNGVVCTDPKMTYYVWNKMYDDGRGRGDKKAKDGIWTGGDMRVYVSKGYNEPMPGPLTIRLTASDKKGNVLYLDVNGVELTPP